MKYVEISIPGSNPDLKIKTRYCDSFLLNLKGLMFEKNITPAEGILLVEGSDSKLNTSIHMFFMNFDISAIWINSDMVVVDKKLAKKWFPFYAPQKAAKYVLECHPCHLDHFNVGDKVLFKNA